MGSTRNFYPKWQAECLIAISTPNEDLRVRRIQALLLPVRSGDSLIDGLYDRCMETDMNWFYKSKDQIGLFYVLKCSFRMSSISEYCVLLNNICVRLPFLNLDSFCDYGKFHHNCFRQASFHRWHLHPIYKCVW